MTEAPPPTQQPRYTCHWLTPKWWNRPWLFWCGASKAVTFHETPYIEFVNCKRCLKKYATDVARLRREETP